MFCDNIIEIILVPVLIHILNISCKYAFVDAVFYKVYRVWLNNTNRLLWLVGGFKVYCKK